MQTQIIRHGEVLLVPVALPKSAKLIKESKREIIAHSETGHHHTLVADKPFKVYSWNGDKYLEIPELSTLIHEKTGQDTHAPHKVTPAVYKIHIKHAFDYFQKKMDLVRD